MKQVLQSYRTGVLRVAEVPAPGVEPGSVLVQTSASLVSVGTERMTVELAKKSLVGKARERPDLVKKVVDRVQRDGLVTTAGAVFNKLDSPIPLGYSCVGKIIAVGEGVSGLSVGDRVACAGAKVANHAEVNLVPVNLCAAVPTDVDDEAAAFVTVGAIALQGVRTAVPTLGESFAVIGLGLLGQLAAQLLRANGCKVIGIDLDPKKVELAKTLGADAAVTRDADVLQTVLQHTGGRGVDGVIITAATSSNDPVELAGELCRDRGRVVVVGAVKMEVPRRPYYDKELSFFQSRSYGPGRYDPAYEDQGHDYPIGYVRWTEQRNMSAFLEQCARGAVKVAPLISHRFEIAKAEDAYALITGGGEPLGVLLTYPEQAVAPTRTVNISPARSSSGAPRIGFIGAGAFASGVLVPALAGAGAELVNIASARGFSARHLAERHGFQKCSTDADELLRDKDVDAVFIATRHNLHAKQTIAAFEAGKHVFVEKPLALTEEELAAILQVQRESGKLLAVGFNRRFAPLSIELRDFVRARNSPLVMHYRVNAGVIPNDLWIQDPKIGGGRIIGELCHFVDLCAFLADEPPIEVFAHGVSPHGGARSDDNVNVSLRFADGSIATIAYVATGDTSAGKEQLEVLGGGMHAVLDDFRELNLRRGGKKTRSRKLVQDKGHKAGVRAFIDAVRSGLGPPIPVRTLAATTRATFGAVRALESGQPVAIPLEP
ncbi:MAG: bi-domain-containing oxidoreductase [Deltaproteobacteria bacterium]|nr:bi-domain-containing oxidoreductase [Deltaproteobacteria bacterium]